MSNNKPEGKRGPPSKEVQIKNKIERMEGSLEDAILKGNQKIVDNYAKYLDVIHKAAMGEGNVSPTNQISCAKVLIEKCEDILKDKESDSEGASSEQGNSTPVTQTASLISLTAVKEA